MMMIITIQSRDFWDVERLSTHVKNVKLPAAGQHYTLGFSSKHSAIVTHKAHRSSNAELFRYINKRNYYNIIHGKEKKTETVHKLKFYRSLEK